MLSFALNLQPIIWQFTASILNTAKTRPVIQWRKPPTHGIRSALQIRHASSIPAPTAAAENEIHMWTDAEISPLVEYIESNFVSKGRRISWIMVAEQFGFPPKKCISAYRSWKHGMTKDKTDPSKMVTTKAGLLIKRRASTLNKVAAFPRTWTTEEVDRLLAARGEYSDKSHRSWGKIAEYVGNRRTMEQCVSKWKYIRNREKLAALQKTNTDSPACDNRAITGKRSPKIPDNWTQDEVARLTAFCEHSSGQNPKFLLNDACNLFPHQPRVYVKRRLKAVKKGIDYVRKEARLVESVPELRQMVKDYGGVEKADWKAISKVAGLSKSECLKWFKWAFVPSIKMTYWTCDEEDRLIQSLKRQRQNWRGYYSWGDAAIDVGKFTSKQCGDKFYRDAEVRRAVEQPLSDTLP